MQSTVSIEQKVVKVLRPLTTDKQQEVLDFIEFLRHRSSSVPTENRISMRKIARLPIQERHQLLQKYIPAMAEDFASDSGFDRVRRDRH